MGTYGNLNTTTGVWRNLPGGRQIEFHGCKDPGDEQKHRGRPHDFLALDEADQLLEFQARFLQGWVRTTDPNQRCRVVIAFNPPSSAEGRWLLDYFGPWVDKKHPRPAKPGELRWYATLPSGKEQEVPDGKPFTVGRESISPRSRTFIPALVWDNKYLTDTTKSNYIATLQATQEPLRSQLLMGDFSAGLEDDPWQVIPTAWVEEAMKRWKPDGGKATPLSAIGVDVARGGKDKTVLAKRRGAWFHPLYKAPGSHTPSGPVVVGLILKALEGEPNAANALVNIDVIGIGASVYDGCCAQKMNTFGINFGRGVGDNTTDRSGRLTFANMRAFAYWSMRELLDPSGGSRVALPPDRELLADLTAAKWKLVGPCIKIESKEDIIKRIGRSPDCADAVVLAILLPVG